MKDVTAIAERELQPLVVQAKGVSIKSSEDMSNAVSLLSQMNQVVDRIQAEKEKVTRPLLDALSAERARWKPTEKLYGEVIESLRSKISSYKTEQDNLAKKAAAKLAEEIKKDPSKLAQASTELAQLKETSATKVTTDFGSVTFRQTYKLVIENAKKVPDKFWIIDDDALLTALTNGADVPGARVEIIQVPINKR